MPVFTDQTGRTVTINQPVSRIVSLVPSLTELLHYLGLDEKVIGITKFCIHPLEWFETKSKIGGTKTLKAELIRALAPDLIIANKEENVKEQVEELARYYPVWISDVNDLSSALDMIRQIGEITARKQAANVLASQITEKFTLLPPVKDKTRACYLIWREPYMTIGNDTFIHEMLDVAGFENIFKDQTRYPTVTIEEIQMKNPDCIFLSSEPFPFKEKHMDELKVYFPTTSIRLADGEMFSWYGSRLLQAPGYFLNLRQHGIF